MVIDFGLFCHQHLTGTNTLLAASKNVIDTILSHQYNVLNISVAHIISKRKFYDY